MPKKTRQETEFLADGAKIDSLLRKVSGSTLIGKLRPGVDVLYERLDGEICQCKFIGIRPMVGLIDDVDLHEFVLEMPGGKTLALSNAQKISLAPEVFNHAEKVAEKSYEELMQEIAELQKQASSVLAAQRKEALGEARALVAKFGFSARELGIADY